jgi:hypothetical protein
MMTLKFWYRSSNGLSFRNDGRKASIRESLSVADTREVYAAMLIDRLAGEIQMKNARTSANTASSDGRRSVPDASKA